MQNSFMANHMNPIFSRTILCCAGNFRNARALGRRCCRGDQKLGRQSQGAGRTGRTIGRKDSLALPLRKDGGYVAWLVRAT